MLHQDGKVRWARLETNLPHDAESLPTCRMVLSDITEQKNTEDILRKSNENYHRIFENQMIAICIYDSETLQIIDVNAHFTQLYGHSREELLGCMRVTDMSAEPEISTELNRLEKSKTFFNPLRFH
jgi:PAS domain-containing protein